MVWSVVRRRRRPSSSSTLSTKYISGASGPILIKYLVNYYQIGGRLHKVLRQIGLELWLPWQHIAPIDLTWGKFCHHRSGFNFFRISFILAVNEDRHKISIKFYFGLNRIIHLGVTCPWLFENLPIDLKWGEFSHHCSCFIFFSDRLHSFRQPGQTWNLGQVRLLAESNHSLRSYLPLSIFALGSMGISKMYISKATWQSWSNFMCSIIGQGERLHKVFGQIKLEPWLPWQHIAPIDNMKNYHHHTASILFWSALFLQITRTGIKSLSSSILGWIGLFP